MSIVSTSLGKTLFFAAVAAVISGVSACGVRNSDEGAGAGQFDIRSTDSVYAYRRTSTYAPVLKQCVVVHTAADSCPVATLPFIGDGVTTPSVDQVMDRVLVTHDWMGARLEQVLRSAPDTLLTLFSSTTAVLIGSNVRPSFYTRLNGAIQIDPVYLWTTVDEKNTISRADDFRSDYGNDLQFWFLSRLAKASGERLAPYYSLDDSSERSVEEMQLPLLRLLFHELVHAADFMPRNKIADIDTSLSVYDSINNIRAEWLSANLAATQPLASQALINFAQVRYRGEAATAAQQATSAANMGELMATDGAIQFYSYTSVHEDLAQLVEAVMMAYHYDSIVNVGFTQKPANEDKYNCDDLIPAWGQRNRLADPLVNVRSRTAVDLVFDASPAIRNFMDSQVGSSELMESANNWCNNQRPSTYVSADVQTRSAGSAEAAMSGPQFREMMRVDSIVHPDGAIQD